MKEPIWFNLDIMQGVLMMSKQQSRFGAKIYIQVFPQALSVPRYVSQFQGKFRVSMHV